MHAACQLMSAKHNMCYSYISSLAAPALWLLLTSLCRAISIFPANASDTTATSKLAPHLHDQQ
jgi:hypothetical protein